MARYVALGSAALALGVYFGLSPAGRADDPAPTTTIVQTVTTGAEYQSKPLTWWVHRAIVNRREANQQRKDSQARGRTIGRLRRANRARLQFGPDGLTHAFLCIHTFEGSWTAATGNGYHGGVQMDANFMAAYGGPFYRAWGTADHWPPFVQIAVAETAYLSGRGFGPWPQTSRACGL